jgi:CRISPR-associated endonuclease/helicase Cas3
MTFEDFFKQALGGNIDPYPYQATLARREWPDLVEIPTGLGKMASVVVSWLYKTHYGDEKTPRRLVYCLPMRVLVEQTASNAKHWIKNLTNEGIFSEKNRPSVNTLMGGDLDQIWDLSPETPQIVIGTQDQLLSRALNRGYAMSRFRWPVHFGLLNNDCLWVMDEVQLMGEGLATTAQLQAFRASFETFLPVQSIWMSATLRKSWLNTTDFSPQAECLRTLSLSEADKGKEEVTRRTEAAKPIAKSPCQSENPRELADFVLQHHKDKTRTLVILNTVKRAQELYAQLKKKYPDCELVLIHSHFRPTERNRAIERLLNNPEEKGTICVTTQVIEAGVDVSCRLMVTELAPWASLIQRFGRCNRDGRELDARIYWLDLDLNKKGQTAPYDSRDLQNARHILHALDDVKPSNLPRIQDDPQYLHVLRKKDLIDLFDTTPDLAGSDIDVSRFIRKTDDHTLHVYWRDLGGQTPSPKEPAPSKEELCSVSIGSVASVSDLRKWRWDHLEGDWLPLRNNNELYPGLVLLLDVSGGCYNAEMGWTGDKRDIPELLSTPGSLHESNDDDFITASGWQTLSEHTEAVVTELETLLSSLGLADSEIQKMLMLAARWHDNGKAHPVSQDGLLKNADPPDTNTLWGKTAAGSIQYDRKGFRHELASALSMIENGLPDLAAYLAAAHHGKVRLSIRSLPNETRPHQTDVRYARGIWDGDVLPETHLGNGVVMPDTKLDLSLMELGQGPQGPSWLSRMTALRDDPNLGPFKLAYLEALLRIADWRASMNQGDNNA